MSFVQTLSTWTLIVVATVLLAVGWITTALAQGSGDGDGDGDGLDGDELGLPILLGVGVLAVVGWMALQRRSTKSRD